MRIALAQINTTVGGIAINKQKILSYVSAAAHQGADIVVFPELAVCGYPPEDLLYQKKFIADNISALRSIAKSVQNIIAVIGFADTDKDGNVYNAAAIIDNKIIKAIYRKENLPNYGVFDEWRYFKPGSKNKVFAYDGTMLGVSICEDIWLDDGAVCDQSKSGAKVLINISASPYNVGKLTEREKLLKKRAKNYNAYVVYVNLVGGQDELVFDGGSLVINPSGRMMAHAKQFAEDLLFCDIGPQKKKPKSKAVKLGNSKVNILKPKLGKDKRPRYPRLERVYQALVMGTRDYVLKNGFKRVIIGLSGGIDSSLVAAVAVDALGPENVLGVTMPSQYSTKGTRSDAVKLAKNLGIECLEIPIKAVFKEFLNELDPYFKNTKTNVAEENLQARIRGNILMALSNKFGYLVLATGNKSEFAMGYCTLYGDMSGGFAVIKDVPKIQVYRLCELFNKEKGRNIIPASVLRRPPSAELRPNQKDQDSLPPYDVIDDMLEAYVERHESHQQLSKKYPKEDVDKFFRLISGSEYKRRQGPPGVKLTSRAFGKDWRLPITNAYKEA